MFVTSPAVCTSPGEWDGDMTSPAICMPPGECQSAGGYISVALTHQGSQLSVLPPGFAGFLSDSCQIIVRYLSDSCQIPVRFLSDSSQISVRFLSDFCKIPVRFLSDSCQIPVIFGEPP